LFSILPENSAFYLPYATIEIAFMRKTSLVAIMFSIGILIGYFLQTPCKVCAPCPKTSPLTATSEAQLVRVTRVIDGDTIELENGQKVRYIGIDTPELNNSRQSKDCFAQQAKEKNQELVEGKLIELKKDVSETDKYGRLLRYVFLSAGSATNEALFINAYLVQEGYAYATTFPPDVAYSELFLQLQKTAREEMKGMWKACP